MVELTRTAENLVELLERGAPIVRGARLVGVRCVHCAQNYLYDEVSDRLWLDPSDPARVADAADDAIVPCVGCGRPDWEFEDVDPLDASFYEGPWSFCFWQPRPQRPDGARSPWKAAVSLGLGVLAALGAVALALNPDPLRSPGSARPTLELSGP